MLYSVRKMTLVISELDSIWKEAVIYNFETLSHYLGATEKNCETPQ
jgi:hypothetical protein